MKNMNKKLTLAASVAIAISSIYSASLTAATVASANVQAIVLAPLTLVETVALNFATVAGVTGNTSTVQIQPGGGVNVTGGAISTGSPVPATFTVTGDDANTYTVSLPASTTLIDGAKPAILVDAFADSYGGSNATPSTTGVTSGGGTTFTVGATVNLADGQPSGTYVGNYSISINYN
jgi:hypothetical protein